MWKLVIEDDEGKRTVVHLSRDSYTVGRKEGNSIRLTERNVSREHARLSRPSGNPHFLVEDVSSYNGVFINGSRVAEPQELVSGDLVQIGDYRIIIQDESVAESVPEEPARAPEAEIEIEDLKSTVAPGKIRRGTLLLERPNRLVMLIGPTPGYEFSLTTERGTIGRGEDQTISVNHNSVSRAHCEILQLAEGRYEIVDMGSANGVRVNAVQLTRGIIEAGDVIELGDVRFKFVAAGQVFLANASDSQQLTAITDRQASASLLPSAPKRSSVIPFVIVGLFLGATLVGGVYAWMHFREGVGDNGNGNGRGSTGLTNTSLTNAGSGNNGSGNNGTSSTGTATGSPAVNPKDQDVLNQARRLALTNVEQAHKDIAAIAEDSPLRTSADFAQIEANWADATIERALRSTEPAIKRSLLESVIASPTVDDTRRDQAKNLLASDTNSPAPSGSTSGSASPKATADTTTRPLAPMATAGPNGSPTLTQSPTAPTTTAPVKLSADDRASKLMLDGDFGGARGLLEPRVKSGRASRHEIEVLKAVCKEKKDANCVAMCAAKLGQ